MGSNEQGKARGRATAMQRPWGRNRLLPGTWLARISFWNEWIDVLPVKEWNVPPY